MSEKYSGLIFAAVVMLAVLSSAFIVMAEENNARIAVVKKCEDAGWTWFATENKCIMVKEVK